MQALREIYLLFTRAAAASWCLEPIGGATAVSCALLCFHRVTQHVLLLCPLFFSGPFTVFKTNCVSFAFGCFRNRRWVPRHVALTTSGRVTHSQPPTHTASGRRATSASSCAFEERPATARKLSSDNTCVCSWLATVPALESRVATGTQVSVPCVCPFSRQL